MWFKWSKSEEFIFSALIRVRRFPCYCVRGMVLLSSTNKFLRDAPEHQTLNSIHPQLIIIISKSMVHFYSRFLLFSRALTPNHSQSMTPLVPIQQVSPMQTSDKIKGVRDMSKCVCQKEYVLVTSKGVGICSSG